MRKALLVSATLLGLMAFLPSANACGWGGYGYYGYGGCGCGYRSIYAGYGWGYGPHWRGGWGYRGGWSRRW